MNTLLHYSAALACLALIFLAVTEARGAGWLHWPQGLGLLHLAAFGQSVSANGALTQINAIQDQSLTTQAGDIRVPLKLPNLVMQAVLSNDASAVRAQLTSPSLRAMLSLDIEPIVTAKVFGSPIEPYWHGDSPIPLVGNESLNLFIQNAQAAAVLHYGLLWLSDGPVKQTTGNIYTVRCTAAAALVAATWVNANLVFAQALPYGRYQVVGMRARSANLAAARLVFPDSQWRPGVPAVNTIGGLDFDNGRYGFMGVLGEFDSTVPPTVDFLGDTDVAQLLDLDLIRIK